MPISSQLLTQAPDTRLLALCSHVSEKYRPVSPTDTYRAPPPGQAGTVLRMYKGTRQSPASNGAFSRVGEAKKKTKKTHPHTDIIFQMIIGAIREKTLAKRTGNNGRWVVREEVRCK